MTSGCSYHSFSVSTSTFRITGGSTKRRRRSALPPQSMMIQVIGIGQDDLEPAVVPFSEANRKINRQSFTSIFDLSACTLECAGRAERRRRFRAATTGHPARNLTSGLQCSFPLRVQVRPCISDSPRKRCRRSALPPRSMGRQAFITGSKSSGTLSLSVFIR